MKKIIFGISLFSLVLLTIFSARVFANDRPNLGHDNNAEHKNSNFNPDKQLSKSACGKKLGDPVVNITQKVQNDVDSGFGTSAYFPGEANYWNVEGYTRHIKVWSTGENTWCAIVAYDGGKFNAFYKQTGPAGTGLIGSNVDGEMQGGYRATFTGVFAPTDWPTNGNVGTYDYDCNLHGVCGSNRVDWVAKYFPGYSLFDQPWWGWIYKADHHGVWVNASDSTSGNIL